MEEERQRAGLRKDEEIAKKSGRLQEQRKSSGMSLTRESG